MKIEGNQPTDVGLQGTQRTERPETRAAESRRTGDAGAGDRVRLTSDVQLVSSVIAAVQSSQTVRPEAVERGRALLANGELGADPGRLADALIDHLLDVSNGDAE